MVSTVNPHRIGYDEPSVFSSLSPYVSLFPYDNYCESDGEDRRHHDEVGDEAENNGGGDGHGDVGGDGGDSGMRMVSGMRSLL